MVGASQGQVRVYSDVRYSYEHIHDNIMSEGGKEHRKPNIRLWPSYSNESECRIHAELQATSEKMKLKTMVRRCQICLIVILGVELLF